MQLDPSFQTSFDQPIKVALAEALANIVQVNFSEVWNQINQCLHTLRTQLVVGISDLLYMIALL